MLQEALKAGATTAATAAAVAIFVALSGGGPAEIALAAVLGAGAGGIWLGWQDPEEPLRPGPSRKGAGQPQDAGGEGLLECLPVGVLLVDASGQVPLMNAPAVEIMGRRPPGRFHCSLLRVPRLLETIEAALAESIPATVDFTLTRDGERHVRGAVSPLGPATPPLSDGTRPAVLVMLEDMTRSRRAEELHRDFVANASHELKTPLSALSGIIETLQGHAKEDPAATERFLGIMSAQAERMRFLVNDLLSLNRIELNERVRPREPQTLRHILGEVSDAMRPVAETAGVSLSVDLPEADVIVPGSFEELAQVFRNLIDNAVKYGVPGTHVQVRPVRDPVARPGMIGVAVIDDGPGIAREHLPRLTERFYRVSVSRSRARGGTGLGLAIVKHVVSRHRGRLDIESTPGKGSRFTVWLPVRAEPAFPAS